MARVGRHVLMDVSPLRRSRDLRCLVAGQLLSTLGAQLTMVAVAYQVYALTSSSLAVGLVSLAQVVPLIAGALLGGSLADAADRRPPGNRYRFCGTGKRRLRACLPRR